MALTEIALLRWQTNVSLVSEDCRFAVQLSRRIWGKSRSYLKEAWLNGNAMLYEMFIEKK